MYLTRAPVSISFIYIWPSALDICFLLREIKLEGTKRQSKQEGQPLTTLLIQPVTPQHASVLAAITRNAHSQTLALMLTTQEAYTRTAMLKISQHISLKQAASWSMNVRPLPSSTSKPLSLQYSWLLLKLDLSEGQTASRQARCKK